MSILIVGTGGEFAFFLLTGRECAILIEVFVFALISCGCGKGGLSCITSWVLHKSIGDILEFTFVSTISTVLVVGLDTFYIDDRTRYCSISSSYHYSYYYL